MRSGRHAINKLHTTKHPMTLQVQGITIIGIVLSRLAHDIVVYKHTLPISAGADGSPLMFTGSVAAASAAAMQV
jgi:hypothetical protein